MIKEITIYKNPQSIILLLLTAAAYFIFARLGLLFAYENTNSTPIWIPSGLALVSILFFGKKIWPAIIFGAFSVNMYVFLQNGTLDFPNAIWASALISVGNTLEALVGYHLIKKYIKAENIFRKAMNVFVFAGIALFMCMTSSIIGPAVVCIAKVTSWNNYPAVWLNWWLGDVTGVLIVAPLLLTLGSPFKITWKWKKILETSVIYFLLIIISLTVNNTLFFKPYVIIPMIILTAFRLRQRELITAVAIIALISEWRTISGDYFFFTTSSIENTLLDIQFFICTLAITAYAVNAAINRLSETENALHKTQSALEELIREQETKLKTSYQEIDEYQQRMANIMHVMMKISTMDFSVTAPVSKRGDELDAIAVGINVIGEEWQAHIQQLEEDEERISTIIESAPDSVIVINSNGEIARWNIEASKTFGWNSEEVMGKYLHDVIIPERFRAMHIKGMNHFLETGEGPVLNRRIELPALKRDNTEMEMELTISPVKIKGAYFFISFLRDITERKKAENLIKTVNAQLEEAQRLAHIGNWEMDMATNKVQWSNEMFNIYGYGNERFEVNFQKAMERMLPEDVENTTTRMKNNLEDAMKAFKEKNTLEFESPAAIYSLIMPDGSKKIVRGIGKIMLTTNGQVSKMIGTVQDITEQEKAENVIRTINVNLAEAQRLAHIGSWEWDIATNIIEWSDELYRIYGLSKEDFEANYENYLNLIHPDDREYVNGMVQKAYQDHQAFNFFHRIIRPDGAERIISSRGKVYLTKEGIIMRMTGTAQDVTEIKKVEEKLQEFNIELQRKNKEIEQFAYIASHDLQEPLRSISNFIYLLEKKYNETTDKETTEYLGYVTSAASRMSTLITDLLNYSRIGKDTTLSQIDCNILLQEILKDMTTIIEESGAAINSEKLPVIKGHTYLKSLFQNLLINAIKFRKSDTRPIINITVQDKNTEWLFAIKDNGIGIEKEYHNRIFLIFQRLHTRAEYQGTGIGLAHCKKIIELHGGKLWLESELGKGSTFYFTIPKTSMS